MRSAQRSDSGEDEASSILRRMVIERLGSAVKVDPVHIEGLDELLQPMNNNLPGADTISKPSEMPAIVSMSYGIYNALNDHLKRVDNCKVKDFEELVQWNNDHPVSLLTWMTLTLC